MPCGTKPDLIALFRIFAERAAIGAHRHAAHALEAARADEILPAQKPPWLRPVLKASRPDAQKRFSCAPGTPSLHPAFCSATLGSTAPCSMYRAHAAHHHVIDARVSRSWRRWHLDEQARHQVHGLDLMQTAVRLALGAWRADGGRKCKRLESWISPEVAARQRRGAICTEALVSASPEQAIFAGNRSSNWCLTKTSP